MTTPDGIMILAADAQATADFNHRAINMPISQLDLDNGFATIDTGGVTVQFADERADEPAGVDVRRNRPGDQAPGCQLALVTDDVQAAFERAMAAGAEVAAAIAEKPWGQRVGYVRDMNGFLLELASPASW